MDYSVRLRSTECGTNEEVHGTTATKLFNWLKTGIHTLLCFQYIAFSYSLCLDPLTVIAVSWVDAVPTNVWYVDENRLYSYKLEYHIGLCKFVDYAPGETLGFRNPWVRNLSKSWTKFNKKSQCQRVRIMYNKCSFNVQFWLFKFPHQLSVTLPSFTLQSNEC